MKHHSLLMTAIFSMIASASLSAQLRVNTDGQVSLSADSGSRVSITDEGQIILNQEGVVSFDKGANLKVQSGSIVRSPKQIKL